MSEQDARAALEAAGFAVEVEYRAGDGDYGTVLSCDPAEGLRDAAETGALDDGFVVYGYTWDTAELLTLIEETLDVASAELLTDVARCPVYLVEMKN